MSIGIITRVNISNFFDAFNRTGRGDTFSVGGLKALFEHLEQLSKDIGEQIELDVIAICCDYTEYATIEELNDVTTVIQFDGGIIIMDF